MARPPASPLGWYHYATAYARSARALHELHLTVPNRESPIRFLYYHAIELFLKSYLVLKGATEKDVRNLSHKIAELGAVCRTGGLVLRKSIMQTLQLIEHDENMLAARYVKIGYHTYPTLAALDEAAAYLQKGMTRKLKAAKFPVK